MEGTLTDSEISRWRAEFPILERSTYLISNSLGAMPRSVEEEAAAYVQAWKERGVRAWQEGWWELAVATGDRFAPILGVGKGQIAMHLNVSTATALFFSCFDFSGSRNRIVSTDLEFPSLLYVADRWRDLGAELALVPSADGIRIRREELLEAIDERTRVVLLSHVAFKSGWAVDAGAIASRCREVGAVLLLDVYQSAGVLPLALSDWGVHAAVGGTLKWLCGGPGAAFLWVDPDLAPQLTPRLTGWQADAEPFAFRHPPIEPASGAWRFLTGTPNVPALHTCRPGAEIIASVGTKRIRARSLRLTDRLISHAEAQGFEVRTPRPHAERGGTVTVAHSQADRLCQQLLRHEIMCDSRPDAGIRFSPHFYNTSAECDRAISKLADFAGPNR